MTVPPIQSKPGRQPPSDGCQVVAILVIWWGSAALAGWMCILSWILDEEIRLGRGTWSNLTNPVLIVPVLMVSTVVAALTLVFALAVLRDRPLGRCVPLLLISATLPTLLLGSYHLGFAVLGYVTASLLMLLLCRFVVRPFPERAGARGVCHVCGYDLRATPQRCPECGRQAGDRNGGTEMGSG